MGVRPYRGECVESWVKVTFKAVYLELDTSLMFQPITGDPGFENNVMTVQSSDFEVFEALAMDSVSTGHSKTGASVYR